jgi:polyphosphate kinase
MRGPFLNRELSWLSFNRRVLEEAQDSSVPLLDRLKFLAITGSNLDEFFMVRVGGLLQLEAVGDAGDDPSGLSPREQLEAIAREVRRLVKETERCRQEIEQGLVKAGIIRVDPARARDDQRLHLSRVFDRELYAVLSPHAIRSFRRVPLLPGLTTILAVRLGEAGRPARRDRFAVVVIPKTLPALIAVPETGSAYAYALVEDVVKAFVGRLFPGERIGECCVFRIARNADLSVREDKAGDLLERMREVLAERAWSGCVRLQLESGTSPLMERLLRKALGVGERETYRMGSPLDLHAFWGLATMPGYEALRETAWPPVLPPVFRREHSLFSVLSRQDVLLVHPYDSFDPVQRLVEEAADDPDVLAIRQILYRTSRESPIVAALARAAGKGKHVTAVVELKARFDEARNMEWARRLEQAGVQVVYGVKGLKTHAKLCMVVRREAGGIRRYLHFGTGNYNEITARLYSDVSYLTSREVYGRDASRFFNAVTGWSRRLPFEKVAASPEGIRRRLLELIEAETVCARRGESAAITAKVNALSDPEIIMALDRAARAGVQIRLNVRGVCCLKPTETGGGIEIVRLVDRYLEHARILRFHHGEKPLLFISSADWMTRNLDRRIELLVPIEDPACRERLNETLETYFRDTCKLRRLTPRGQWERVLPARGEKPVRAQAELYAQARQRAREEKDRSVEGVFEPERPQGASL